MVLVDIRPCFLKSVFASLTPNYFSRFGSVRFLRFILTASSSSVGRDCEAVFAFACKKFRLALTFVSFLRGRRFYFSAQYIIREENFGSILSGIYFIFFNFSINACHFTTKKFKKYNHNSAFGRLMFVISTSNMSVAYGGIESG
jgi:hypothetical protein